MTRAALSRRWTEAGEKLADLAEAFPEERYQLRAADGTRSVAEQLRHAAFRNGQLVVYARRSGIVPPASRGS